MEKILNIEFEGENFARLMNISWILRQVYRMETGADIKFIKTYVKSHKTLKDLSDVVGGENYQIKLMKDSAIENGINPNWLKEYKDIDLQDYLYLLD